MMKTQKFILLVFVFVLFCSGSCEREEWQRFIIQNNSDMEIIVVFNVHNSIDYPQCIINRTKMTRMEYQNFIYDNRIVPHSNRDFGRRFRITLNELQESVIDTLYVGAFYRIDIDTMSCEEFKQKYPLKKEWILTLADMEAVNWTLVYP